jgi:hypothetical protein
LTRIYFSMLCGKSTRLESAPALANVRLEIGKIADGYFDVMDVADDLAELESRGKLKRAPTFDWGGVGSMPKTRIAYELPSEE